ncbi:helix-turn-helix domain-containing protein [Falsiroseomonas sp.]|uniref:helix-turn-helix domain-containing protein n=1 Tax=Falsiroseomonas sp. TaxID=2870721 RepID=UPI002732CF8E|nr:XRE family transcriptional regulator [Falsiroseomonas sp.]MDP3416704.1 XRE family transcriptional regulator [Falsiroseomonas sp.]
MPSTENQAPRAEAPLEAPDEDQARLASRLRAQRLAAGLSLAGLAAATGLTKGYLSKVERGVGQPSIGTVFRIAEALGVPVGQLLASGGARSQVADVARVAARPASPPTEALHLRPLLPGGPGRLIAIEMWPPMEARPAQDQSTHAGEELLHVLSGRMEILFETETLVLECGDTLRFDARRPHRTRSLGAERARVLVVLAAEG